MSAAVVLAVAAGAAFAGAVVDLVAVARRSDRRPPREEAWLARLAGVGRRVGSWAPSRALDGLIAAAGLAARLRGEDVMAAKVGAAAIGPIPKSFGPRMKKSNPQTKSCRA